MHSYLVDNSILDKLTVIEERGIQTFNKFEVSYHFLETENLCVRRRTENDVSTYTFSRTFTTPDGIQEVAERPISRKEYQYRLHFLPNVSSILFYFTSLLVLASTQQNFVLTYKPLTGFLSPRFLFNLGVALHRPLAR